MKAPTLPGLKALINTHIHTTPILYATSYKDNIIGTSDEIFETQKIIVVT